MIRNQYNKTKRYYFLFLLTVLFLLCLALTSRSLSQLPIQIDRLSDKVVVLDYLNVRVSAIEGRNGLIVIDTHRSPSIMAEMKELIENTFGRNDFLYIVNTHGHWDHSSGNQVFPDSILVGHKNCPEFMRQNPANSIRNIWYTNQRLTELKTELRDVEKNSDEANDLRLKINVREMMLEDFQAKYRVTPPVRTFEHSLTLDAGDITVILIYCGRAHTNNDILVYVPEEKLVFTGDLFHNSKSFGFSVTKMTDVPQMLSALDRILDNDTHIEFVVTSHTERMTGDDLHAIRALLVEKYSEFENRNSAALYLEQLMRKSEPEQSVQKYEQWKSEGSHDYYFLEKEFHALGRNFLWEGLIDEAIVVFALAVEQYPESALAYDNLAEAYMKNGKIELAIQNYEKSLELLPENRNAEGILNILRSRTK